MSLQQQIVGGLKWISAAKFASQAISWAVTLIVIRLLHPQDYGLMAMATVFLTICTMMAEMGMGMSIVQAKSLSTEDLSKVAAFVLLLNFGIGITVALAAPLVAWAFHDGRLTDLVRVMSLQFVFSAFSTVPQALMSREMRFKRIALIDLCAALVSSIGTLALAWAGAGVWALVYGALAANAGRMVLSVLAGRNIRPDFRMTGIGKHLKYGGSMTAARFLSDLVLQSDMLIAGRFLSTNAVGVYAVAYNLATLPMHKISGIVNQVAFPTIARLQQDPVRLREGITTGMRFLALVTVPLLWGLSSCAPEFVTIVLGRNWLDSTFLLQVISVFVPIRMLGSFLYTAASATGQYGIFMTNVLFSAAILPAAFLIGAQFGADGMAIAWGAGWTIVFAVNYPRLGRSIDYPVSLCIAATKPMFLAGIVMYGTVSWLRLATDGMYEPLRLALFVVAGAIAYCTALTMLEPRIWKDLRSMVSAQRA